MNAAVSLDDPGLADLLDRWHALRGDGREPSASELTTDPRILPALEGSIAAIKFAEQALGGEPSPPGTPALGVPGRFEVVGDPAVGGMAEVYRARDVEMGGRIVAYKVMKPGRHGANWLVDQFYREAAITDEVRQPGVVPIYAKLIDGSGRPAYAMEFVFGVNLNEAVRRLGKGAGPGEPATRGGDLLRRFLDACRIVAVAHAKGYVHGDLNLKNIMLVEEGRATRVVDWGSALRAGSADEGRPGHAAAPDCRDPALGPGQAPGFASDVYALGRGLGKLAGALGATGDRAIEGRKRAGALRALGAIAARAGQARPEDRYPDASALAEDLGRFLSRDRVLADSREPFGERAWRWGSRHRAGVSTAVAVVVIGSIALGLLGRAGDRATLKEAEARQSRQLALQSQVAETLATCQILAMLAEINPVPDRQGGAKLQAMILESKDQNPEAVDAALRYWQDIEESQEQMEQAREKQSRDGFEKRLDRGLGILDTLIREYPEEAESYRARLSGAYVLLAISKMGKVPDAEGMLAITQQALDGGKASGLLDRAAFEDSLRYLEKSSSMLPPFAADAPADDPIRTAWNTTLLYKAMILNLLGRFTEGLEAMDHAIEVAGGPDEVPLAGMRVAIRMAAEMEQQQMPWSLGSGADHARAARLADYLGSREGVSGSAIFNAACQLALASQDGRADPAERRRRADRAMAFLAKIADAEYFQKLRLLPWPPANTIHELHTDFALAPLRDRPDFRALIARFPE